jgi:hypothetical protein
MSVIIGVQDLANIAYLTGAEIGDLYIAHVANVNEFHREYQGRHPAELATRAEIVKAVEPMRAKVLTLEFIEDTLSMLGLLRYNADETLADEALARIEARGFHTYRALALHNGHVGFQAQRRQEECEDATDRYNARNWQDGVDDGG